MKTPSDLHKYRELGLKPFQAEFVQECLLASIPSRQLLVAELGLGKTHTALFVAKTIADANPSHRILVIGPGVLSEMYAHRILQGAPDKHCVILSHRVLRELEGFAKAGQPTWPAPVIAIMGMDTARQELAREHLQSVDWDLVILDEVHQFTRSRRTLLKTILLQPSFQRVLLLTARSDLTPLGSLLKNVQHTRWITSEMRDWDGSALFSPNTPEFRLISYSRSDDERAALHAVLALTKELSPGPVGRMIENMLLRRAASSVMALERTVRALRNRLAHGPSKALPPSADMEPIGGLDNSLAYMADTESHAVIGKPAWRNNDRALRAINKLLFLIESIRSDEKMRAVEELLNSVTKALPPTVGICVVCSFRDTAQYLQTVFEERGGNLWLLVGNLTPEQFLRSSTGVQNEGGVLIATSVALQGSDLRNIRTFIHYDQPTSDAEMRIRTSGNPQAQHYVLKDESGILPVE